LFTLHDQNGITWSLRLVEKMKILMIEKSSKWKGRPQVVPEDSGSGALFVCALWLVSQMNSPVKISTVPCLVNELFLNISYFRS